MQGGARRRLPRAKCFLRVGLTCGGSSMSQDNCCFRRARHTGTKRLATVDQSDCSSQLALLSLATCHALSRGYLQCNMVLNQIQVRTKQPGPPPHCFQTNENGSSSLSSSVVVLLQTSSAAATATTERTLMVPKIQPGADGFLSGETCVKKEANT